MGNKSILILFLTSAWHMSTAYDDDSINTNKYAFYEDSWNTESSRNHLALESFLENVLKAEDDLNWIKQVARQRKEYELPIVPNWGENENLIANSQYAARSDHRYSQLDEPNLCDPVQVGSEEHPSYYPNGLDSNNMLTNSQRNLQTSEYRDACEGSGRAVHEQNSGSNFRPSEEKTKREISNKDQLVIDAEHLYQPSADPLVSYHVLSNNNYNQEHVKVLNTEHQEGKRETQLPVGEKQNVDSAVIAFGDGIHEEINRKDTTSNENLKHEQRDAVVDPNVAKYFEKHGRKNAAQKGLVSRSCHNTVKFPTSRAQKQEQERQRLQLEDADGLLKGFRDSSQIGSTDNQMEINKLNHPTMPPIIIAYRHATSKVNNNLDSDQPPLKNLDEIKSDTANDASDKLYNKVDLGECGLLQKHQTGSSSLDHNINKREGPNEYSEDITRLDSVYINGNEPKVEQLIDSSLLHLNTDSELQWDNLIKASSEKLHDQSHTILSGPGARSSDSLEVRRGARTAVKRPSAMMEADGKADEVGNEGEEGIDLQQSVDKVNEKASRTSDRDRDCTENHQFCEHPKHAALRSGEDYVQKYMSSFKSSKDTQSNEHNAQANAVNDFSFVQKPFAVNKLSDAVRLHASYVFPSKFDVSSGMERKSTEVLKSTESSEPHEKVFLNEKFMSERDEDSKLKNEIDQDRKASSGFVASSQTSDKNLQSLSNLHSFNNEGRHYIKGDGNNMDVGQVEVVACGCEKERPDLEDLQSASTIDTTKQRLKENDGDTVAQFMLQSPSGINDRSEHVNQLVPANDGTHRSNQDLAEGRGSDARIQLSENRDRLQRNAYISADTDKTGDENMELLFQENENENSFENKNVRNARRMLLSVSDGLSSDEGSVSFGSNLNVGSALEKPSVKYSPAGDDRFQEDHGSFSLQIKPESMNAKNAQAPVQEDNSLQSDIKSAVNLPTLERVKRSDPGSQVHMERRKRSSEPVDNDSYKTKQDASESTMNNQGKQQVPLSDIEHLTITNNDYESSYPLNGFHKMDINFETVAGLKENCVFREEDEDENEYKTSDQHEGTTLFMSNSAEVLPIENEYLKKREDLPHRINIRCGSSENNRRLRGSRKHSVKDPNESYDHYAPCRNTKISHILQGYSKNKILDTANDEGCISKDVFKRSSGTGGESVSKDSEEETFNNNNDGNERDKKVLNEVPKVTSKIEETIANNMILVGGDNNPADIRKTASVKVVRDTSLKNTFPYLDRKFDDLNLVASKLLNTNPLEIQSDIYAATPSYESALESPVYQDRSNYNLPGLTGDTAYKQADPSQFPALQGMQSGSYDWGQGVNPSSYESANPYLCGAACYGGNTFARSVTSCACRTTTTATVGPYRTPQSTPYPSLAANLNLQTFPKASLGAFSAQESSNKYHQGRHMGLSYSSNPGIIGKHYNRDVNCISSCNKGSCGSAKDEENNGELDDGELAMKLVLAVFKQADKTPSLKRVVRPGLKCRLQAVPVVESEGNRCKCHQMLHQIMQLMYRSGGDREEKQDSTNLPPDLKEFKKWLLKNSPRESSCKTMHHVIPRRNTAFPVKRAKGACKSTNCLTQAFDVKSKREVLNKLLSQYSGLQDKEQIQLKPIHDYLVKQVDFLNTVFDSTPFEFAPLDGVVNGKIVSQNFGDMQENELIEKNLKSLGLGGYNSNNLNMLVPELSFKSRRNVNPAIYSAVPSKYVPSLGTRIQSASYVPDAYKHQSNNDYLSGSNDYTNRVPRSTKRYKYIKRFKRRRAVSNGIGDRRQTSSVGYRRHSAKYKRLVARDAQLRRKRQLKSPPFTDDPEF